MRKLSLADRILTGISVASIAIGVTLKIIGAGTIVNEREIYSTTYLGKKASIIREEKRLDFNNYYILLNDRDRLEGEIVDDLNKKIRVYNGIFSHGYEISNFEDK